MFFLIIALIFYLLYQVRIILLPFILAILFAYLINPLIEDFVEDGINRLIALIFVFSLLILLIVTMSIIVVPAIIEELELLINRLPRYARDLEEIIIDLNRRYRQVNLPPVVTNLINRTIDRAEEVALILVERTSGVVIGLFSRLFSLIIAPIISFYILKDLDYFEDNLWSLIPQKDREGVERLLSRINKSIFGFFKGQLTVSLIVGLMGTAALYFLGVKFYLIIGLLFGVFNLIPYFGPIIGSLPGIIIASFSSLRLGLIVALVFFLIQQLESSIIAPKIMGDRVGLHPTIIIFALLAGGELLGIVGMLIAIPIAAVVKEFLIYLLFEVVIPVDNR